MCNKFKNILRNNIYNFLVTEKIGDISFKIIEYVKKFGKRGKLSDNVNSLKSYYDKYLQTAYEWAGQKVDGIFRDGFMFFRREFEINVIRNFILNKRGLIYVERSINIGYNDDLDELSFKSIGECWSWKRFNSKSYCSDFSLLRNDIINVVICGYVHPDSVDWLETVYLNSYDMKNETEIRMNSGALVEVSYIKIGGQRYSLGGSYLLDASSDKYRK